MSLILCIETSSKNCSVSISDNGKIIAFEEQLDYNYCHGEKLHVLIEKLLRDASILISSLDAFCFSLGPGSYTGLRIGASAVKGFAQALGKPVINVSTLQSMSWGILYTELKKQNIDYDFLCPVLDSRQGEVYTALYDIDLNSHYEPFACNVKEFSFLDLLNTKKVYFFGPGCYKLISEIEHVNAFFLEDFFPSARYLGGLAQIHFNQNKFADLAYFEPLYLKEFIATKSKK